MDLAAQDPQELIRTVNQEMPFGRFRGRKLIDVPEPYLVWFKNEGFPNGPLGTRMALMYEIKVYGLEKMLRPLVAQESNSNPVGDDSANET